MSEVKKILQAINLADFDGVVHTRVDMCDLKLLKNHIEKLEDENKKLRKDKELMMGDLAEAKKEQRIPRLKGYYA